jgi:hypothetical protein
MFAQPKPSGGMDTTSDKKKPAQYKKKGANKVVHCTLSLPSTLPLVLMRRAQNGKGGKNGKTTVVVAHSDSQLKGLARGKKGKGKANRTYLPFSKESLC